jgi:uncharacterized DUF497 family protein
MELEYDPAKDARNIVKHGLSLADAMLVYENPDKVTWPSVRPGDAEDRMLDIAMVDIAGVTLVLIYVIRGNTVRAISMRRASKTERRRYEEAREN